MRRLGILCGLGILACSSVASPSHPKEDPKTTPLTQETTATLPQAPAVPPTTSKPSVPQENALLPGAVFRIVELAPEDPLLKDAASLVGLFCAVGEAELLLEKDSFAQGDALCGPKKTLTHFTHVKISVVYHPQKNPTDPNPGALFSGKSLGIGRSFLIHELDGRDAYFTRADKLRGLSCIVTKELKNSGDNWFTGSAKCGVPVEYMYFSRVSIEVK